MKNEIRCPTVNDLKKARKIFLQNEPRNLFYRAATELIKLAINRQTNNITLSDSLAVLLQTWNRPYYRFRSFDDKHFNKIDILIKKYANEIISNFRPRSILSICDHDKERVCNIFHEFEIVLGPVGAAKSLHLLAPQFFPLWDRKIAEGFKVPLKQIGKNEDRYWCFIETNHNHCEKLSGKFPQEHELLKAIDEYNYCHYTKGWI